MSDLESAFALVAEVARHGYWLKLSSPWSNEPGMQWHAGFTPHYTTGWNGRPDYGGSGDSPQEAILAAYKEWQKHPI